ncbi:hypothetical protein SAMN05443667_12013 [Flavobacterium gillisiae]|uniref:Uncharacterized protein n=1 Tax=Flavobacterium gillisiae TaxID=150146 RepID=A0A1H4GBP1_9FLAO|nr:hypothetical protein [Flavobacterium gillisiae]SEB07019.1 hypothetical protein SAMN05443667_12013 [Flavobacterium gillisiae]
MIYYQYEDIKHDLSVSGAIADYLFGKPQRKHNRTEFQIYSDVTTFEALKQVAVELNARFGFENDLYFTNKVDDAINFNKYRHIFTKLESYQFTNLQFKSFADKRKAQTDSLYEVLIKKELITDNKTKFIDFLQSEYNFKPAIINSFAKKINYEHNERVLKISDAWDEFAKKNMRT